MKLEVISDSKPGAPHNEDLFGFLGDTFWLFDGATSLDGPPLARDARWLVQRMGANLSLRVAQARSLVELAIQACRAVAWEYPAGAVGRPRAAMALFRIRAGRLEAALTGNVSLIVRDSNGATEFTDWRGEDALPGKDDSLLEACRREVSFESEEFRTLRRQMKYAEAAALQNSPHSLITPAQASPDQFLRFERALSGDFEILAATDGFMELRRYLDLMELEDFLRFVRERWNTTLQLLRQFESAADSGQRLPRTKRHDDATAAAIRG